MEEIRNLWLRKRRHRKYTNKKLVLPIIQILSIVLFSLTLAGFTSGCDIIGFFELFKINVKVGLKVDESLEPLLLSENERENPLIANYVSIIRLRNLDSDSSTRYIRRTVVIPYMARSAIYIHQGCFSSLIRSFI